MPFYDYVARLSLSLSLSLFALALAPPRHPRGLARLLLEIMRLWLVCCLLAACSGSFFTDDRGNGYGPADDKVMGFRAWRL